MVQQIQWLCVGGRGGRNLASGSCSQNINGKQLQKPEQFSAFWHNFFLKNKAISIKLNDLTSSSNIELQLKFFYEFIIHLDHKWGYYGESNLSNHNQRGRQQRVERKDKKDKKENPFSVRFTKSFCGFEGRNTLIFNL